MSAADELERMAKLIRVQARKREKKARANKAEPLTTEWVAGMRDWNLVEAYTEIAEVLSARANRLRRERK